MIKHYCDKCKKEIFKDELFAVEMRIRGFTAVSDNLPTEFCEPCFREIIGEDNFAEIKQRKLEREKRIEARRAVRYEQRKAD